MKHKKMEAKAKCRNAKSKIKRIATSMTSAVPQKLHTKDCMRTTVVISSSSFSLESATNTNETRRPSMQTSFTGSVTVIVNHSRVLLRSSVYRAGTVKVNHSPSHGPRRSQMHAARKGTSMTSPASLKPCGRR